MSFHSGGAPDLRPGAISQSPGLEAALPGRASPSPSQLLAFAQGKEQTAEVGETLEKEMATHSSVLTWRIPGTEEPGELPSMGSHRVGHD